MKWLGQGLLDLLFPPQCVGCGALDPRSLCTACLAEIQPIRALACERCGAPRSETSHPSARCPTCALPRAFDRARACFLYEGPLREAVRALKFRRRTGLIPVLQELMLGAVQAGYDRQGTLRDLDLQSVDLVCPVPLHLRRYRERGFNQAELLGEPVARFLGATWDARLLKRVRETRPQPGLSAPERDANVAGAFVAVPVEGSLRGCHVLIIDDLMTTGATMSACALALRIAGAGKVGCLALARPRNPADKDPLA